jgi:hypothetical protein
MSCLPGLFNRLEVCEERTAEITIRSTRQGDYLTSDQAITDTEITMETSNHWSPAGEGGFEPPIT